jgi:opacity protein-like surface antigen
MFASIKQNFMQKLSLNILILLFLSSAYGQTSVNIRAGTNIATTKNLISFAENRIGWYGGLSFQVPVVEKLFFQPELLYSSKGHRSQHFDGTYNSRRLNYLNVPVLFNYQIDKKTSLILGPEFGYLLSARVLFDGVGVNSTNRYPSRFDAAACIGLQYCIVKNASVDIRYNYGFNTLYSVDAVGNRYSDKNGANRVFQIGIKYKIKKL